MTKRLLMNYWLLKTEPETYSYDDLVKKGRDHWDGVRNYTARNNLREMKPGDLCLIYHSVGPKDIVGLAEVVSESYPDPTTEDDRWVVVDIVPKQKFPKSLTLQQIKGDELLSGMELVRQSRLSVAPVRPAEFDRVLQLCEAK